MGPALPCCHCSFPCRGPRVAANCCGHPCRGSIMPGLGAGAHHLATWLPGPKGDSALQHDFLDQPLTVPDGELYRGGSSFMENGQQRAGFDLLTAFKGTVDHHSLQRSPRRFDRHYRINGSHMHLEDLNLWEGLRKLINKILGKICQEMHLK